MTTLPSFPFPHPGEEFLPPGAWIKRISNYYRQQNLDNSQITEADFRGRAFKDVNEAWQAAWFGYAYGCAHRLVSLTVRHERQKDLKYDATFRWEENGKTFIVPVQLKELPPARINPELSFENLVDRTATKYSFPGLILALHLNRGETHTKNLGFGTTATQYWCWGWTAPQLKEVHLAGGGGGISRSFRITVQNDFDMSSSAVKEFVSSAVE